MLCYFQLELFCANVGLSSFYIILNKWIETDNIRVGADNGYVEDDIEELKVSH